MGTRRFFEHDADYLCYVRAEKEVLTIERNRIAKQDTSNFWSNYLGFMAMLLLPQFVWWNWDFKWNPCRVELGRGSVRFERR